MFSRTVKLFVIIAFMFSLIGPVPKAQAQPLLGLPEPGTMVYLSPSFNPPVLKGIKVYPDNPFRFDFILDKGDSSMDNDRLKEESNRLIKYFLASLTIPEKDLWVNLSPYEGNRIVPRYFGQTEMGRDLLAQDYLLKQITATLIYPESGTGKKFWKRIYEQAESKFGTTNIPVNTFNKVWIIPEKAVVYENARTGTAYVIESKLKVMLEQDYLSLQKHEGISIEVQTQGNKTSQLGSQIVREIVIPELTKEVNENRNFAQLRQVYNSLILATWYKKKIKDSILNQIYANKNKVEGVATKRSLDTERIYQRYLQAFKKGVYNYIKEDIDPVTQETVPRKYFSGGVNAAQLARTMTVVDQKSPNWEIWRPLMKAAMAVTLLTVVCTVGVPLSNASAETGSKVDVLAHTYLTAIDHNRMTLPQLGQILDGHKPVAERFAAAYAIVHGGGKFGVAARFPYYQKILEIEWPFPDSGDSYIGGTPDANYNILSWAAYHIGGIAGTGGLEKTLDLKLSDRGYEITLEAIMDRIIKQEVTGAITDDLKRSIGVVLNKARQRGELSDEFKKTLVNFSKHVLKITGGKDIGDSYIWGTPGPNIFSLASYNILKWGGLGEVISTALSDEISDLGFQRIAEAMMDELLKPQVEVSEGQRPLIGRVLKKAEALRKENRLSWEFNKKFDVFKGKKSGFFGPQLEHRVVSSNPALGIERINATSTSKDHAQLISQERRDKDGGIDLSISNLNWQLQNSGQEIKFHIDPAMLQQLQNAPGFLPVTINIQPLKSLQRFLGLD